MRLRPEVEITASPGPRHDEILTLDALQLVASLERELGDRRVDLLARRAERAIELSEGGRLGFLSTTRSVRDDPDWQVAPLAPGLVNRRVEITGPTERKMTVNALNSGAEVWLADFEDANAPLFENMVQGQVNLVDALDRCIDFTDPTTGKRYALLPRDELATIVVRPRGWHLVEKHVLVGGSPVSAALFDFALAMTHCARRQIEAGTGPYFYLPKLESHLEARLWNDAFCLAQDFLAIPRGTIRATVLIETFPAAFEMDEILYELREHAAGLNAGRWDYLFSVVKCFRHSPDFVLPDRNAVTMGAPFMRAYTQRLVHTCHARGAHAIGGMAAYVPSRTDPAANDLALDKVRADKQREAADGFDGSWVAHPDLVPVCRRAFDEVLAARPHQIDRATRPAESGADEMLDVASTPGAITEAGLRNNVSVGVRYLAAWLGGTGAVALYNLMEDTATAEIARSQVWQWAHHQVALDNDERVTPQLVHAAVRSELRTIRHAVGDEAFTTGRYEDAAALFTKVAVGDDYLDFLTLPAYELLP